MTVGAILRFGLVSATLVAAPAVAAEQFDLICSGTLRPTLDKESRVARVMERPISVRYHVDLPQNRWCATGMGSADCSVKPLAEIEPDMLWFEHNTGSYQNDPAMVLNSVSRTSGEWKWYMPPVHMFVEGTCEPAAFTGFASGPTKF